MAAKNKDVTIELSSPVSALKGVGPKKAEALERLGLFYVRDFLENYPRAYEDYRNRKTICQFPEVPAGTKVMVKAKVLSKFLGRGFGMKRTLRLMAEDNTGRMEVLFFNAGFLMSQFQAGAEYCFYGQVKVENSRKMMLHPSFTPAGEEENGIVPLYRTTKGVSQKEMRKFTAMAVELADAAAETLPRSVIDSEKLCSLSYSFENIHFPKDENSYGSARYRIIFEEFFDLRMALMLSKDRFGQGRAGNAMKGRGGQRFIESLPYKLTNAQAKVWDEVRSDMESPSAMNRLVQGDVGSGKTAIAEAALCQAVSAGYQGAFMAPTEILAAQHFETLTKDFEGLGINTVLLTGSMSAKERKAALASLADGSADIAVGTHAVISDSVEFANLGLVITDEQHRFGVNQRKKLTGKGDNPDVMVMTATPIPRTLAVVLYGDLDVSIIDELPPGRRPIETRQYDSSSRRQAYKLLLDEVKSGRQAYTVAPFIEDSEEIEGYSAEGLYEDFTKKHPDISCALLHGAMKQDEKDRVMTAFYNGEVSVLISTVVIEVGINVPNASVMLIENSERFGLAQMHQLRGRVGRGSAQSYCLLVLGEKSEVAAQRADILCESSDGFFIAEKDLEIRGPGELFGYRQHGLPQLHLADPAKHLKIAEKAGAAAASVLSSDPELKLPDNRALADLISEKFVNSQSLVL